MSPTTTFRVTTTAKKAVRSIVRLAVVVRVRVVLTVIVRKREELW